MAEFTYKTPEPRAFLHTIREYLSATNHDDIATLLIGASCLISVTSQFSGQRWNAYRCDIVFHMPVLQIAEFDAKSKSLLSAAVAAVFPAECGYDVNEVVLSPLIEAPADEDEPLHNAGSLGSGGHHQHDGLRFRSKTEIRVYDELKQRDILFFANATAVLAANDLKREPDFLICQDGKWGILEVMGNQFHSSAMKDHDRARLFKRYGLFYIEFYDARRCYNETVEVVSEFLEGLARS